MRMPEAQRPERGQIDVDLDVIDNWRRQQSKAPQLYELRFSDE